MHLNHVAVMNKIFGRKKAAKAANTPVRILDFKKNKVEVLQLDELQQTVSEQRASGKPINDILHYDLFEKINERITQEKLDFQLQGINCVDGGRKDLPGVSYLDDESLIKEHGEHGLGTYLVRRLIAMYIITTGATADFNYKLAVAFHQEGIQVGFGPNVINCDNMSIMSANQRAQSYGPNKMPVEKLLEVIGEWLNNFKETRERELRILTKMKEIDVPHKEVAQVVGELNMIRLTRDSKDISERPEYPLNQSQINRLAERYLVNRHNHEGEGEYKVSLFDLYNLGTDMQKPGIMDLPLIIPANHSFGQFFIDKYQLN